MMRTTLILWARPPAWQTDWPERTIGTCLGVAAEKREAFRKALCFCRAARALRVIIAASQIPEELDE